MFVLQQVFLAKALYDNMAETPDELAFRRGDVITVLEQDTGGLDGWWLCSLRGKQGIAPGNRLKILSGITQNSGEDADGLTRMGHSHDAEPAKCDWQRSLEKSPNKVRFNTLCNGCLLGSIIVPGCGDSTGMRQGTRSR